MGGQVLGNALISAVGSINWGEVALDGVAGGISGFVGGNGISTKHLMNLGKQSVIRPVKALYYKGAKAAVSEAKKAATYYVKSAKHAVEPLATS